METKMETKSAVPYTLPHEKAKMAKFGIKKKLLCAVLSVVLIVMIGMLSLIYSKTNTIVLEKSNALLTANTQNVVRQVTAWMNKTISVLEAERDAIQYFSLDKAQEIAYIKHTANKYEAFPAGIYVATTDGELRHSSFVPGPEFNVFQKPWYKDGMQSEAFIFGDVYFDESSQSYVVGASGMLKDSGGAVRGVAAADIYLTAISKIIQEVQIEKTGGVFLVDGTTGTVIGHREASLVGMALNTQNGMYKHVSEALQNALLGLQTYEEEDGTKIYLEIEAVPNSHWFTVAYVPYREVMQDLNDLTWTSIGIAVLGILLLILCVERSVHAIIRPLKKLTELIAKITEGDFSVDSRVCTRDEIGLMADRMHTFILSMRGILHRISSISGRLGTQSATSEKIAEALSHASKMQSDSMQQMNTTIEEMSKSIGVVAENATSLSSIAADVQESGDAASASMGKTVVRAEQGRKEMESVIASMQAISEKVEHLKNSVREVSGFVGEIESIVGMIRGIAAETALLSLNASIEAARAGEAGRGFAVVAEQIGKLAATSSNAVNNIANLTETIHGVVEKTMQDTKESVAAIAQSEAAVAGSSQAFEAIFAAISEANNTVAAMTEKIHEVSSIAMEVAGITEEQSAASEEILANAEQVKENSDQVMLSSKTVEEDAQLLGVTAKELQEQMQRFKYEAK